jgi:hypothetical protein
MSSCNDPNIYYNEDDNNVNLYYEIKEQSDEKDGDNEVELEEEKPRHRVVQNDKTKNKK